MKKLLGDPDILAIIFGYLDAKSLTSMRLVSRYVVRNVKDFYEISFLQLKNLQSLYSKHFRLWGDVIEEQAEHCYQADDEDKLKLDSESRETRYSPDLQDNSRGDSAREKVLGDPDILENIF